MEKSWENLIETKPKIWKIICKTDTVFTTARCSVWKAGKKSISPAELFMLLFQEKSIQSVMPDYPEAERMKRRRAVQFLLVKINFM